MVIQIFQLFLFVPHRHQRLFIRHNLHIHRSGNRECELLLLIVEDLRRWEVQFSDNVIYREVGDVRRLIFTLNLQISLVFLYHAACRADKVITLYQRYTFQFLCREVITVIVVGDACIPVDMFNEIAEVVLIQPAELETPRDFALQ